MFGIVYVCLVCGYDCSSEQIIKKHVCAHTDDYCAVDEKFDPNHDGLLPWCQGKAYFGTVLTFQDSCGCYLFSVINYTFASRKNEPINKYKSN